MSLKVVIHFPPENESPKITTNPAKTFKSSRTVRLPVQFPNRCASPSVSPPCAKRLGRSVGGGGMGGSVAPTGGVWGESSLCLSTLDTSGDWAPAGRIRGQAASPSPFPGSTRSPQLTTLLPRAESQRPSTGGTRRHVWVVPRHIATLTLRDPRARLGFRAGRGNHSGNPKPLLRSQSRNSVSVATETGPHVTSLPPSCRYSRLLGGKEEN